MRSAAISSGKQLVSAGILRTGKDSSLPVKHLNFFLSRRRVDRRTKMKHESNFPQKPRLFGLLFQEVVLNECNEIMLFERFLKKL